MPFPANSKLFCHKPSSGSLTSIFNGRRHHSGMTAFTPALTRFRIFSKFGQNDRQISVHENVSGFLKIRNIFTEISKLPQSYLTEVLNFTLYLERPHRMGSQMLQQNCEHIKLDPVLRVNSCPGGFCCVLTIRHCARAFVLVVTRLLMFPRSSA